MFWRCGLNVTSLDTFQGHHFQISFYHAVSRKRSSQRIPPLWFTSKVVKLSALITVLWSLPFPVSYRRAGTICANPRRNGGDCDSYGWWPVSGWNHRRLLHSSNIQLFHQGCIPWWVSTSFQAIHAFLLLCKFKESEKKLKLISVV